MQLIINKIPVLYSIVSQIWPEQKKNAPYDSVVSKFISQVYELLYTVTLDLLK